MSMTTPHKNDSTQTRAESTKQAPRGLWLGYMMLGDVEDSDEAGIVQVTEG
jgi:hypothetical protein